MRDVTRRIQTQNDLRAAIVKATYWLIRVGAFTEIGFGLIEVEVAARSPWRLIGRGTWAVRQAQKMFEIRIRPLLPFAVMVSFVNEETE